MKKYDVAVVGGGISGCMAALAAARSGVSVILIERWGFLGGTLTACGTGPMMTFHAGDRQVVRGICDELIERLKAKGLSTGHILDTTNYTYTVTPFDTEGMKRELEDMCIESGVSLMYHCCVIGAKAEKGRIVSIEIAHKKGRETMESRFWVDASGDCDLTYMTGGKYVKGREKDGKTQPLTMNLRICNVDVDRVREYIKANRDQFPCTSRGHNTVDDAERLSMGGYVDLLRKAVREKRISFLREDILFFETNTRGEIIVNTSRVLDIDPTDPVDLTRAEILGRKQAFEVFELLKNEACGFENAVLEYTGPSIGVRSSRQIVGRHILTAEELLACTEFPDTVAYGGYPIDIHSPDGLDESNGINNRFNKGEIYNIPLSCMYGEIRNLVTVGRCISAAFEAQAAIRVSPIAGAIGQAGGVAAALCASRGTDIQDIDIRDVKRVLREQNAYEPSSVPA